MWLVAFPLEATTAWAVLTGLSLPTIAGALALHVLASGLFGASLLRRADGKWQLPWPLLGTTIALLAFPLIGMAAVAAAYAAAHLLGWRRTRGLNGQQSDTVEPSPADAVARAHEVEVGLLDELEIEPVVDVLRENDPELKRAAIEALTRQGGAGAVRVLIGLLHSPSPDARFFSSIALSRLEDEISRAILAAQHSAAENPGASGVREHLAELYLDYALSGFLEGVTRDYYLDLSRDTFEEVLPVTEDPDGVMRRLARVYLLQGSIGEAAALLDDLARRYPADVDVHLLRMDVIYQFGDFRELTTYARRAVNELGSAPEADSEGIIPWWAEAGQAEALRAG